MPRTVVLRHELPDGSHHFDWLIDPMGPGAATAGDAAADPDRWELIAWRLPEAPDAAAVMTTEADRLPLHRRLYLDYEGPISRGRGCVRRVASGEAEVLTDSPERFEATGRMAGRAFRLDATPVPISAGSVWRLTVTWD